VHFACSSGCKASSRGRTCKPGGCEAELWVVDFQPGLKFEQTFLTVLLLFNFKLKIICIFFVGKN
jgi:hypothetical protein